LGAARVLDVLLNDALSLFDWVYARNGKIFKRPQVYFQVWPKYDSTKLRYHLPQKKYANAKNDAVGDAIDKSVAGGEISFGAWAGLNGTPKGKWMTIEIGFFYNLEPLKKSEGKPRLGIFAGFEWNGDNYSITEEYISLTPFPGEEQAQKIALRCLRESIRKTRKAAPIYKGILDRLELPSTTL
jgi:hypothetical protein